MTSLPPPPAPPGAAPGDDSAARRRALLGVGVRADLVDSADTARDLVLRTTSSGVTLLYPSCFTFAMNSGDTS